MTCLALDDEPLALQLLEAYVSRLPVLAPQGFFNNPDHAQARLAQGDVELLFLDIQMPDVTGLQFLRQLEQPPMVIFTTAFAEYAVEGFNLDAVDYLLKPFDFQRFEKAVTKAVDYRSFLQTTQQGREQPLASVVPTSLFVKVEYSVVQIPFDDILYVEGFDDYVRIHVASGRPVLTLMRLKNLLELLPPERFARVHRSYIVALPKIEKLRAQKITLAGQEIPVGDTYVATLKGRLSF
jgi:DNA-binding LytR/AlgR family response regulator